MLEDKIKSESPVQPARSRRSYDWISAAFGVGGLISVPILIYNNVDQIDSLLIVGTVGSSFMGGIAGYGIGLAFQHGIEALRDSLYRSR